MVILDKTFAELHLTVEARGVKPSIAYTDLRYIPNFLIAFQIWGLDRNITEEGGATSEAQLHKLQEELDELAHAIGTRDYQGTLDGIGDMVVVLAQILNLEGLTWYDALDQAWEDIKDRKGKMVNGVFVKEAK